MAFYAEPCQIFESSVRQQLELLQGKRDTVSVATENYINRIQKEVDDWLTGGHVTQQTFEVISNRIQQAATFFILKAVEFSGPLGSVTVTDVRPIAPFPRSSTSKNCQECKKVDATQTDATFNQEKLLHTKCADIEINLTKSMTARFTVLEEAVSSLKKVTENVQEKQENLESSIKEFTILQDDVNKTLETLTKCKNNANTQITKLEEQVEGVSSKVYHLLETVTDFDGKMTRLEERNASMADINKEMNDTVKSVQDLSERVESTNQQYNEISDKMNKLEKSIKDASSQRKNELEALSRNWKVQFNDSVGMICQMLSMKLAPLEKLRETLNKKLDSSNAHNSKKEAIENCVAAMSARLNQFVNTCSIPTVGFTAQKCMFITTNGWHDVNAFKEVDGNQGRNFDPRSGVFTAPLDGIYFLSITTDSLGAFGQMNTRCFKRGKDEPITEDDESNAFVVQGNKTLARCIDMTAGDTLCLKCTSGGLRIYFSCFMIK